MSSARQAVLILLVSAAPAAAQEFTARLSLSGTGAQGDRASGTLGASLSDDGRFVAFASDATNLVPGDSNNFSDAFLLDRQTGSVERLSLTTTGQEANPGSGIVERDVSISGDGQRVVFCSDATNLVPGVTAVRHIYFLDRPSNAHGGWRLPGRGRGAACRAPPTSFHSRRTSLPAPASA